MQYAITKSCDNNEEYKRLYVRHNVHFVIIHYLHTCYSIQICIQEILLQIKVPKGDLHQCHRTISGFSKNLFS